jgi:hypothetical protein
VAVTTAQTTANDPVANASLSRTGEPLARRDDAKILWAVFGSSGGSADVTPIVQKLATPGKDEFYVAPAWLEVDPSVGQPKELVVLYEWRGEQHVLMTRETGAVSNEILVRFAALGDGPRPVPASAPGDVLDKGDSLRIIQAYYGRGATYHPVTARVRELLREPSDSFEIDSTTLRDRAGRTPFLLITFSYRGQRTSRRLQTGERVSYEQLTRSASANGDTMHSVTAPGWLATVPINPAREPGDPGPGFGRAPHREAAIADLLQALADITALDDARANDAAVVTVTSLMHQALTAARHDMRYEYPREGSQPVIAARPARPFKLQLQRVDAELNGALRHLRASSPGGPTASFRLEAISDVSDALVELRRLVQ